jgi:GMP synthase (glutamine-hydrolysing)
MGHRIASVQMSSFRRVAKVLIILHQEHSTPGRVGALLRQFGFELDIRRPALGCALPDALEPYAGVVVFGGPMSANDGYDWLKREIDWIARPLAEQKPLLGLCLGAQLLARQLGSRVYTHGEGRCELGYHPLRPTPLGDSICSAPLPRRAYQWHFDGFDIPDRAYSLAAGVGDFPNQAFLYGRNAVGLQFHPEVTFRMMCRWTAKTPARLSDTGGFRRQDHLDGWYLYDRSVAEWLAAFLRDWVDDRLRAPVSSPGASSHAIAAE